MMKSVIVEVAKESQRQPMLQKGRHRTGEHCVICGGQEAVLNLINGVTTRSNKTSFSTMAATVKVLTLGSPSMPSI